MACGFVKSPLFIKRHRRFVSVLDLGRQAKQEQEEFAKTVI
jgi:hypothetical protein